MFVLTRVFLDVDRGPPGRTGKWDTGPKTTARSNDRSRFLRFAAEEKLKGNGNGNSNRNRKDNGNGKGKSSGYGESNDDQEVS